MIELERINDSDKSENYDEEEQNILENSDYSDLEASLKSEDEDGFCCEKRCQILLLSILTLIFMFLWLAESQFSEGVLRYKYENETCSWSISKSNECAPGLECHNDKCRARETIVYRNQTCECPICQCPSCPSCNRYLSYFDFNEFPNMYLLPQVQERTKIVVDIPYGGCKELCARTPNCKAVCYQGGYVNVCHIRSTYTIPGNVNNTWSCAIKVM